MSRIASKSSPRETVPMDPKPIHDSTPGLNQASLNVNLDNLPTSLARIADQMDIVAAHNDSLYSLLTALGGSDYSGLDMVDRSEFNPGALGYLQYLASLLEYQNERRGNLLRALGELI